MSNQLRQSGVDLIGDVPWGTHFCQFYQSKKDLLDILIPYFKAGLENNEFCVWVTSKPLEVEDAKETLKNSIENLDKYLDNGQIEIISYDEEYIKENRLNFERSFNGWMNKLNEGLNRGFEGLRLSGNIFWFEQRDWNDFFNSESEVDAVLGEYNILALYTYCLDNCTANQIVDVVNNHQFSVIKRDGKWTLLENITKSRVHDEILNEALKKYAQLNKTLMALRDSSRAMMHASDENNYLEDLCRIVVDDCGHSLVWIGFIDKNTRKVVPVAHAGFDNSYIEKLDIILDDPDRGRGPTGTAIRIGKPCICENMHTDPKFKPWRDEALKRGYSSSIVLPLISNGEVFGALNIYSIETDPFSAEETMLLTELADDISYGITSLKLKIAHEKAEKALRESLIEVERSNAELEQFAYVTSHDLREPLRMISSFLQLLERRYHNKLDEEAIEFIGFAVDGAKRLDAMINDILIYSRVANKEKQFKKVHCDKVLDEAYLNLKASIEETNAEISKEQLPTLMLDEHLMIQLFQNLLSNAIKYRSDETPKIHVFTKKEEDHWLFGVKDNGIGISKKHAEKIFTIFQRLHTKDEYEGTGIGLAIAQKIVHQHGGDIWVESEPGEGSTFYFTIPETISDIYDS